MILNFRSSEAGHFRLLREALTSFGERDTDFKLCAMGGHNLNVPRCFKLFSHFLSDIIDSCPPVQEVPTIILPDCPVNSIKHLVNLLTQGSTQSRGEDNDVKDIIEVANVLKIDIKNLVYDEKIKQAEPKKVDELEEGEIVDDEEDFLLLEHERKQKFGNKIGINIASFAKVNSSNPNIMTNTNGIFPCLECKRNFGTEAGLETHLRMTSKHNTGLFQCTEAGLEYYQKMISKHGNENVNLHLAQDQQPFVKKTGNQKASLAKVDGSNPKIMTGVKINNNIFPCLECMRNFGTEAGLEDHLNMSSKHTTGLFNCAESKNSFSSEDASENPPKTTSKHVNGNVNMHLAQEQQPFVKKTGIQKASIVKVDGSNPNIMTNGKNFGTKIDKICKVCGQVFQSIRNMVRHVRIVHEHKPFKCNLCEYVGCKRMKLKKHLKNQHDIDI